MYSWEKMALNFQNLILNLSKFWSDYESPIHLPYHFPSLFLADRFPSNALVLRLAMAPRIFLGREMIHGQIDVQKNQVRLIFPDLGQFLHCSSYL